MEEENKALAEISIAQQALDRANDIHEILDLRDKAMAMQIFANAQGFEEAAQKAKIYQLKAERKAGEWLSKNVVQGGHKSKSQDATLIPEGINKDEFINFAKKEYMKQWDEFDEVIQRVNHKGE